MQHLWRDILHFVSICHVQSLLINHFSRLENEIWCRYRRFVACPTRVPVFVSPFHAALLHYIKQGRARQEAGTYHSRMVVCVLCEQQRPVATAVCMTVLTGEVCAHPYICELCRVIQVRVIIVFRR